MAVDVNDLVGQISLTPYQAAGIPIALLGSVFLSLGAQFQHRGVVKVERRRASRGGTATGLGAGQLLALLGRPSWLLGTLMLGLAIALQLTSLIFAPLIVVQPLGAVGLVISALLNSRVNHVHLHREAVRAIIFCVGGIGLFVLVAAIVGSERPIGPGQLLTILGILVVVLAVLLTAFSLVRRRAGAVFYIIGAGVLYGFVATLAKVTITRIVTGNFEFLTVLCIIGLLAAAGLGAYFVQTAYSLGSPDLVIAGLTVVDPIVAVLIGVTVLGEAAGAPFFAGVLFVLAGVIAVYGVFQLAKHQPQTR